MSDNFTYGVDLGWLTQLEDKGISWQQDGEKKDVLEIVRGFGADMVRIRAFVNPPSSFEWTKHDGTLVYLGYADTKGVLHMAKRAREAGMKLIVDFHYSDHFADPEYQDVPEQWEGISFEEMTKYVYDYTHYVMNALAEEDIYPEWVQVGNEINSGMLLPYGDSTKYPEQLAQLLNSGYDAVKAVSPDSLVITHLAEGQSNSVSTWFFDNFLVKYSGKTDVIGLSYYPYWIGTDYKENIADLTANLKDLVSRYGKPVMVVEVGSYDEDGDLCYDYLRATIDAIRSVPNQMGIGICYWEPEVNAKVLPDSYPLGACEQVSEKVLAFNRGLQAYADSQSGPQEGLVYQIVNRNSSKALNVKDGSVEDGATVEQYGYDGWDSQKWQLKAVESGYYVIENIRSGKVLEVEALSTEDGAACVQWTNNEGWNQQWSVESTDNGYFVLRNRNSGKVLDVYELSAADGAACVQWSYNEGWNQQWSFLVVS